MVKTVTLNIKRNMIDTSNRLNIKINVQKNNGLCERPDVLNVSSNYLIKHITRIKVYLQYWKQLVVRKTYQFNNNSIYIFIKEYVGVRVMVFNATFNNISAISWRLVILVDETRVPDNVVSSTSHLSGIWTHNFSGDRYWLYR